MNIKINQIPLVQCESYKYLGIHFDSKLNWSTHIQHVCTKVSKACGALAKLRHSVPAKIIIDVFNALINSYLRYGILVWGSASQTNLNPLETLINKAIRIISFAPFGNVDLSPVFQELNILQLSNIHSLEIGKFIYKEKSRILPTTIGNYFPIASNFTDHHYETRVSTSTIPTNINVVYRLKSSEKSVQFKCHKLWCNLPDSFKSLETLNIFKKRYKKFLISLQ